MEQNDILFAVCAAIVIVAMVLATRAFINTHILGTFKYDNSGETYRGRFEFADLDDVEKHRFAIVKVEEADLNLPGEKPAQNRQPL